jgi:hypothetical protein
LPLGWWWPWRVARTHTIQGSARWVADCSGLGQALRLALPQAAGMALRSAQQSGED